MPLLMQITSDDSDYLLHSPDGKQFQWEYTLLSKWILFQPLFFIVAGKYYSL